MQGEVQAAVRAKITDSILGGKSGAKRKGKIKKLPDKTAKQEFDYLYKIILIGSSGAGKTSMLLRFCEDRFSDTHMATIGVDFKTKTLNIENKLLKVQLWDTAGQEKFKSITRSYYKNSHGCLAVYDVTNRQTFEEVMELVEYSTTNMSEFARYGGGEGSSTNYNIVLVGNKCDMDSKRQVSFEEGERLAARYNVPFYETSAKKNLNIDEVFYEVALQALRRSNDIDKEKNEYTQVKLRRLTEYESQNEKGGGCKC